MPINPRAFGPPSARAGFRPASGLAGLSASPKPPELGGDLEAVQAMRRLPTFPQPATATATAEPTAEPTAGGLDTLDFADVKPDAPQLRGRARDLLGEGTKQEGLDRLADVRRRGLEPEAAPGPGDIGASIAPSSPENLTDTPEGLATAQAVFGGPGLLGLVANLASGKPPTLAEAGIGLGRTAVEVALSPFFSPVTSLISAITQHAVNQEAQAQATAAGRPEDQFTAIETQPPFDVEGLPTSLSQLDPVALNLLGLSPHPNIPGAFTTNFGGNTATGPGGAVSNPGAGVSSTEVQSYRRGGRIPKRGRRSDPRRITAHEGEYVVDEDSTARYLPLLEYINREEPPKRRSGLDRLRMR